MSSLLELQDVVFGYPSRPIVLDGVSLTLDEGERIALTGANGAGKSTILQLAVGLLRPHFGRVVAFGDERTSEADFQEVRRRMGLVFQDPDDQLFCPTVLEDVAFGPLNLGIPPDEARAVVDRTLETLALAHLRDRVTHQLSGGEKRLVSLATVLAMEPEVLLLDEPSNGLDEATTLRLVEILSGLPQAVIVVSHDAHFRRRIALREHRLVDGRLIDHVPRCPNAAPPEDRAAAE